MCQCWICFLQTCSFSLQDKLESCGLLSGGKMIMDFGLILAKNLKCLKDGFVMNTLLFTSQEVN